MASRILVRRRKAVSDCITAPIWSVQSPRNLNHGQFTQFLEPQTSTSIVQHFSSGSNASRNKDVPINSKDDWINISALGQYSTHIKRQEYIQWVGLGLKLQMIRHVSTATARQPNYDDEEDEEIAKKRKDASPEECDEVVVGLSMARAKVKPHLRESQKRAKTVLQRFWAIFFRAGPALRAVASISRVDWSNKLVHWKNEFTSTLQRYWLGFKLLGADVRISCRLLVKLADGKSLSRRERQQLTRTTADIFRLVPFAVFIIVPFMEFLLPVFLKLFPNMLPSTFQDKMKEQEALKRKLNARMEYAKFLQDTVRQMAKEVQNLHTGEIKKTSEDLDEFLNKVRRGARGSNEEILSFAKLFNDELTLDNISRPRLVNMCKYMGISPFGTDAYLRYMLQKKLQRIKFDDRLIQGEGIESLSEAELREECRERGMLGLTSVEEMQQEEEEENKGEQASRESTVDQGDVALNEMVIATAKEVQELARVKAKEKQEQLCELSRALTVLASASSVSREREEFLRLVKKEIELCNSMVEKQGTGGEMEAIKAYKAAREESDHVAEVPVGDKVSAALIDRVDAMLQNLEKEIDDVDSIIGNRWQLLDRDFDGKVTAEEVAAAAVYLKHTLGKEGVQELIRNLSKDGEGKILVEDIVKLGSQAEDENADAEDVRG